MRKKIFFLGYRLARPEVVRSYKKIKSMENYTVEQLKEYQNKNLRKLIKHAVKEVPYYRNLFDTLNLLPEDIKTVEDLTKLPILTKEMIKENPQNFIAENYKGKVVNGSTGGSTGTPLKYKMSDKDYSMGVALLLRGFGFGGYEPGDSMSIIAGGSLVSKNQSIKSRIQDRLLNFHHLSSYGMTEKNLDDYYYYLNKEKPKYIRGYASSLYLLAKYMEKNALKPNYQVQAIYSTAEKLIPSQRIVIEHVFNTKVFDNYGLNDGGIGAFECNQHTGMHIDYERSILEVSNDKGDRQLVESEGKILATSLFNYAMPFIRYETGDLGEINQKKCSCGCKRPLLKKLSGRVTDYIKIDNVYIGSPVLTVLMGKVDVENYQIIQTDYNKIKIILVKGENYTQTQEKFIINSFHKHVDNIEIEFKYKDKIETISAKDKKYKFIINNDYK